MLEAMPSVVLGATIILSLALVLVLRKSLLERYVEAVPPLDQTKRQFIRPRPPARELTLQVKLSFARRLGETVLTIYPFLGKNSALWLPTQQATGWGQPFT